MCDIARILYRDFPTEDRLLESCRAVHSTQDNLWPLDGTEEPEAAQARRSRWNQNSDAASHLPMLKRRKVSHDKADGNPAGNNTHPTGLTLTNISCSIGTMTTMQNNLSFMHCTEGGFVSAAVQLQQNKQERQRGSIAVGTSKGKTESSVSASVERTSFTNLADGQGTLPGFFGKEKSRHAPQAIVAKSTTHASLQFIRTRPEQMNGFGDLELPEGRTLSRAQAPIESDETYGKLPRKPLADIPSALGNHKLPPLGRAGRPCLLAAQDDHPSKQYVFLSSSPPPMQEALETAEVQNEDPLLLASNAGTSQLNPQAQKISNCVRPATTFHSTSVAHARAAPSMNKKTLGVRRSVTGWANRANKGFSVPSKTVGNG